MIGSKQKDDEDRPFLPQRDTPFYNVPQLMVDWINDASVLGMHHAWRPLDRGVNNAIADHWKKAGEFVFTIDTLALPGLGWETDASLQGLRGASGLPLLRQAYVSEVSGLKSYGERLLRGGVPPESVARILHQLRRDIGIRYKNMTPPEILKKFHERNIEKYGDKLGPSIEYLRAKGKSWMQIIQSASGTGGKDLGL